MALTQLQCIYLINLSLTSHYFKIDEQWTFNPDKDCASFQNVPAISSCQPKFYCFCELCVIFRTLYSRA